MKARKIMIQSAFSLFIVLFFCQQIVFSGELTPGEKRRIESGAIDTFEAIISLWKRERYDEIYEYGDRISRKMMSKEKFMAEMSLTGCVLASSWETVRDIEAQVISQKRVYVKAKMGFKGLRGLGETRFFTQSFEMILDKDEWRIELRKLLKCPY